MSFESELDRRFSRILNPKAAADMLTHGGYERPLESGEIAAAVREIPPEVWGLAVETARRRTMRSRAGEGSGGG